MRAAHWLLLLAALCGVAGCGATAEKIAIPATPDGTVTAVSQAISDDKPQAIWQALPDKYQQDVNGLIKDFAAKMDAEVWDKGFVVLGKLTKLAKDKREFILAHQLFADGPVAAAKDDIAKNWDSVVALFDTIANSELKTVDGLKKLNVDTFLAVTGGKLIKDGKKLAIASGNEKASQEIASLKSVKVTIVEEKGDTATVEVEAAGRPAHKEQMKKVDGKWLPAEIVNDWDKNISQAKKTIAAIDIQGKDKTKTMQGLAMVETTLDQLLAAKTQEEFNASAESAMFPLMSLMGGAGGPPSFDEPSTTDFSSPPPDGPTPFDAPPKFDSPPDSDPSASPEPDTDSPPESDAKPELGEETDPKY